MAKQDIKQSGIGSRIAISIFLLLSLTIIATIIVSIIMLFSETDSSFGANTALIPIEGVIQASSEMSAFQTGVVTSDQLLDDIKSAEEDESIKAVIFLINSPGGSAVASDEVATAIKNMKKLNVAVVREVGASGAYWIASSTDHVIANRMSITGSIGVISSYLSFGHFLDDWNVTYNQLVAGERKDVGTPFRELSPQERAYLQMKLDVIHDYFISAVAENRNMSVEKVRKLADGRFFLGKEALDVGLVDQLGSQPEGEAWVKAQIGEDVALVTYEHKKSLLDLLSSVTAQKTSFPLEVPRDGVSVPMAK